MGNCCWKNRQNEPNQPIDIVQIPAGKTSKPVQETTSSVSSNTLKGVTGIRISHPQKTSEPQPRKKSTVSSNAKKKKLTQDERYGTHKFLKVNPKDEVFHAYKLHSFSYNILKNATRKFSEKNLIGRGGSADVYRGWIDYSTMTAAKPGSGYQIAVKRLRKEGSQGREEWLSEMKVLGRFHHPHVVKLIGYCKGNHRILVYEYMTKGSLEAHLLRRKHQQCTQERGTELNWSRRIKIAIGTAKGLEFLHSAGAPIIHRDIKSSNILLDHDFTPKISDFGLAKFGPQGDQTHITTRVLGTKGYFAPEYVFTGHLTLKTDVYGFGVVLLEILSGSSAVKRHSGGEAGELVQWAKPYLSNRHKLHHVIDKKLRRKIRMQEAYEFAEIILGCLDENPKRRPTMTEVVIRLEQLERNMNNWNQTSLSISTSTQAHIHSQCSLETKIPYLAKFF